jgi:hypothetical protein
MVGNLGRRSRRIPSLYENLSVRFESSPSSLTLQPTIPAPPN